MPELQLMKEELLDKLNADDLLHLSSRFERAATYIRQGKHQEAYDYLYKAIDDINNEYQHRYL